MTTDNPAPAHRPAIGSEQGQLKTEPAFAIGDSVILQSTGEIGVIVSDADDLGYRVRVLFRGQPSLRFALGHRLRRYANGNGWQK